MASNGRPTASHVQPPLAQPGGVHMPPSRGAQPTWDPRLLLNPRASSLPINPAAHRQAAPSPGRAAASAGPAANQIFQFSSPGPALDLAEAAEQPAAAANGVGAMIERINNVESRAVVPEPKRRKLEPGAQPVPSSSRGSSGMLGGYIKDQNTREVDGGGAAETPQTVDLTEHADADADVVVRNPGLQEVCYGTLETAFVNCHSVPAPRPGGLGLASAGYWPPIKAILKRKVNDPTTTVQVYDHTRQVFGTVDHKTSAALARLFDAPTVQLRTESRIPSRKRQPDEVIGQPISRTYRLEITLFGRRALGKGVGRVLKENRLRLINPNMVPRGIPVDNPHAGEPSPTAMPKPAASQTTYMTPVSMQKTLEEVRNDVMNVFDTLSKSQEFPEMEPGPAIVTELLPHQKQGLFFMTARENPDGSAAQSKHIGSLWQKRQVHGGRVEYLNLVTQHSEAVRPKETLGGILADMMGLGKTLSILSLIASSLDKAREWADKKPEQPLAHKSKKPSSRFSAPVPEPLGLTQLVTNAKTTLLVCPLSTITNWEEQIKQHVKPQGLSYYIYHGQNRITDPNQLACFDLVLTTYGSVSSELTARNKGKAKRFPLEEIGWFRIVLDEAHMIREQGTLQFKAACRLQASRRWAVTGTPVQNRLDDLAALLAFLRLKPFDDRGRFNQHIVTPFKMADPEIIPKLRLLVDTVTLRRLKDKIQLPSRTDQVVKLEFSPDEQRLYDMFAKNAKDRVQALTGSRERILGGKTYIHILQSILRLRLVCAHGADLLSDEDLKAVQGMTQESAIDLDSDDESDKPALSAAKAHSMFHLMKQTNSENCVMCQRKPGSNDGADTESERPEDVIGFMTPCFHIYCPKCIRQWRSEEQGLSHNSNRVGTCPICHDQVKFAATALRRAHVEAEDEDTFRTSTSASTSTNAVAMNRGRGGGKKVENYGGPHTKTIALVAELLNARKESELMPDEPPIKSVVFSGWTSHLNLIEIALDAAGIKHTRLDGKMTRTQRTQSMDVFRDDPSIEVILVSITAGGLGLNLTAGSRVFVMEPQYNPAAEAQAVDRVHRLGQKRAVKTVRYIMKDSFEEQMVALQEKKIKLANLSMNRDVTNLDKREAARQRLMDLKDLFK
ncbi:transcription termination factor 2 [Magnaporthiopsis poae ATCC 64411]|uniref:Transcription termination factor 2 n=1 Tax=Magnaporthiopsis poae (strain ATCC 64411 / 73-15) TaxID=644358 RepID=A0A0C4DM90_MAGP6|nr:transcription termination factor 2 [Magnaporthiopsis poae ATCC 64411]